MITTYQVSKKYLNTTEQNSEAHTDRLILDAPSTLILTSLVVQILIRTSSSASLVEYKETVYK